MNGFVAVKVRHRTTSFQPQLSQEYGVEEILGRYAYGGPSDAGLETS